MDVEHAPRPDVGGPIGVFNAALVGFAGLYAGTGSLWLTGVGGALAAGLAGAYLAFGRQRREVADTGGAAMPQTVLDGEGGGRPVADPDDGHKEFAEFFRAEYPRLVYTVMRLGATKEEAEDVVCDVMARLFKRWPSIREPRPYTYRSVVNEYRDKLRAAHPTVPLDQAEPGLPGLDCLDLGRREHLVLRAVGRLPATQQLVMVLHYVGLSHAEIAEETGTPVETVRSNLRHGRKRLKALLIADDLIH